MATHNNNQNRAVRTYLGGTFGDPIATNRIIFQNATNRHNARTPVMQSHDENRTPISTSAPATATNRSRISTTPPNDDPNLNDLQDITNRAITRATRPAQNNNAPYTPARPVRNEVEIRTFRPITVGRLGKEVARLNRENERITEENDRLSREINSQMSNNIALQSTSMQSERLFREYQQDTFTLRRELDDALDIVAEHERTIQELQERLANATLATS